MANFLFRWLYRLKPMQWHPMKSKVVGDSSPHYIQAESVGHCFRISESPDRVMLYVIKWGNIEYEFFTSVQDAKAAAERRRRDVLRSEYLFIVCGI